MPPSEAWLPYQYLSGVLKTHLENPIRVVLADAELRSWRMAVGDEPAQGVWAKRYWTENAKIAI